jgi:uncharacterized protein
VSGRDPAAPGGRSDWGPVADAERSTTLDALRGVAIFGMLLANILIFALPAESRGLLGAGATSLDNVVALFQGILVEGKFYTLFSILFGMGLALQSKRAEDRGSPFTKMYLRRILALAVIGIAHGLLLFSADILAFYAIIALAALPFRKLQPRALLRAAVTVYAAGVLIMGAYSMGSPERQLPSEPDWRALAAVEGGARAQLYEFMADEERVFQRGSFAEMVQHRTVTYLVVGMPLRLLFTSLRTLGLFLLGMYLLKRGVFVDGERNGQLYRKLLAYGLTYGVLLQLVGGAAQGFTGLHPFVLVIFLIGVFAGIPALSLGYAGGVAMLCAAKPGSGMVRSLAAVGRTALTNYVGQSVILGSIFYSFGLGLFGRLSAAQAVLLAIPVFAVQAAFSVIWLRHFRFGPLEWLWRTLSYWRIQPLQLSRQGIQPRQQ